MVALLLLTLFRSLRQTLLLLSYVKVSSQADIDALQKTAGVVRIYEDKEIPGPTRPAALSAQDDAIPDANLAHKITGVLEARKQYGVSGKGIKVGVIDSGLDWKHPAFGAGTSFPTPRVPFGYDFVGDKYQSGLEPVEDNDPMDCGGHGTHCAGIIGANSTSTYIFTGVAPEVTFGAYRVFGCSGSTDTSIIVKAIERAFADGMDIISMSLGSNGGFPSGLDVDLINKLTDTGKVVFTIAQGNGQSGLIWQSSNPAIASQSIAVAATNNFAKVRTRGITVNGKKFNLTVYDDAAVPVSFTGDITLNTLAAPAPGAASNSDGCIGTANAVGANTNPKGKVLLIRRGTCVFTEKGQQAQAGGAVAVIVYNHGLSAQPALYDFTSDPSTNITIPFYTMDAQSGSALAAHLLTTSGSSKLAFDAQDTASVTPEITVTTFTSWGPGPDLSFKPDVAAPGNNILSTIPLAQGGFGLKSGTSMATPYTAGIIALYLQYAKQISGNPTTSTVTTVVGGYSTISGGGATTTPGVTQSPVKCIPRPTTTAAPAYGRRLTRRADSPALLSKLFDRNPIFIRDRLQNAGKPLVLGTTGELETAVLQGGGLIQVPKLFATRVSAVPGKFALGSFQSAQQHTLTVTNYDSAAQTVVVGSVSALAVDITNANAPGYIKALNPITFAVGGSAGSESVQVILAPGESKAVTVSFVPSADIVATNKDKKTIVLVSGWITVSANGIVNNAAYSGLIGDITNAVYHEDTPSGLQNAGIFPSPGKTVCISKITIIEF
ncbi:peptidase S8/S53 domain-containing protein [Cladochytrium replicatum]|nr:peptidase S8/S53 domain-containing protein [Cladochytrium replicatum]